jgi:hypothetical protein
MLGWGCSTKETKRMSERMVRVTGSALYLDSPAAAHGVTVWARTAPKGVPAPDGWLHVEIEADESIVGYAVELNGRGVPISAGDLPAWLPSDRAAVEIALDELEAYIATVGDADEAHARQRWAVRKLRALLAGSVVGGSGEETNA